MPLTHIAIRNAKFTGTPKSGLKLSDGGGLHLLVLASGKYWRYAYRFEGKQKLLALGVFPRVSLSEARELHRQAKEQLAQGQDPSVTKRLERHVAVVATGDTFKEVAQKWFEVWRQGKAEKTIDTKWKRLERDLFPFIGSLRVQEITAPQVIAATQKVQKRGARDVAERILSISDQVFRYAIAHGMVASSPIAQIKPSDILPVHKVKNQARVDVEEFPQLLRDINTKTKDLPRLGLLLLAHTFVRTKELTEATWDEFDFNKKLWRIPAKRMKMGTEHMVPLTEPVLALLQELKGYQRGNTPYIFPGVVSAKVPMSNNTMLQNLHRLGYKDRMTGHGFRGVASTILHEHEFEHAHIELQLAHVKRDKVSAAYNHATYMPQRTEMMAWWSDYINKALAS